MCLEEDRCHYLLSKETPVSVSTGLSSVQDMYPSDAGLPGSDFSGTVPVLVPGTALADILQPGDAIFGLHPGCLGTVMVADPKLQSVALKPAAMTHREASTTATIFLTVEVALHQVMHVQGLLNR